GAFLLSLFADEQSRQCPPTYSGDVSFSVVIVGACSGDFLKLWSFGCRRNGDWPGVVSSRFSAPLKNEVRLHDPVDHLLDDNFLAVLRWGRRSAALAEVNMPHDLDTSIGGIGAMLVHRNKQREVLARINDDDRAKACRSAIFHDYGMQVGIPVPHIVDPGHGLLVESPGHDVNRLLGELHGRDQFIGNWLAVHFLVPKVGLKLSMSRAVERRPPAAYQAKTGQRGAS